MRARTRGLPAALLLLVGVLLAGCGGSGPPAGDSAEDPAASPGSPAPTGTADGRPAAGGPDEARQGPGDGPGGASEAAAGAPSLPSTWAYICPGGLRIPVHYRADEAIVTLPDRELRLPPVPAASGTRYQSGDTVLWDRGGEAFLEMGETRHAGCEGRLATSPEDAARLLGFDFRALGQEPGWLLDVDLDRQLRWVGDYGVVRFATPAPEVMEETDSSRVWRAAGDGREIVVTVVDRPCRDAMSGQPFTHTVTVEVGGDVLDGCGRWLGEEPGAGP